ncbi:TetR/AcrR family transcriptional regulator [Snodgrassella gandavensis]|uniref:TetR/AcrR family transcriptional regulator n=1 Tax=Snodgrassella gandavensis TaxID=2946698 RepID=UPI001EF4AC5B|nr:helix-turn-helix domain-containing protein [Snodgrassella gandavensis]
MNKREMKKLEILTIAEELLAKQGSANFSVREVAKKCGHSLSSIQYYFPTLTDLLAAMFDKSMDDAITRFNALKQEDNNQLEVLVNMIVDGLDHASICKLACEIWTTNDESGENPGQKALLSFYSRYIEEMSNIIKQKIPYTNESELKQKVVMIIALFEGLLVIYPLGKNNFIDFDLKEKVLNTVKLIINT